MEMMLTSDHIDASDHQTNNSRFIHIPLCCQDNEYTCGVACVQSLLKYYGLDYRLDELAGILQSKPVQGTDFRAILSFMRQLGFQAEFAKNLKISDIKTQIDNGISPMLLIQAWADNGVDYALDW